MDPHRTGPLRTVQNQSGVRKRRPPLACLQCYQRKLKCGKEFPSCSRCVKAGLAHQCTYRGNSAPQGRVSNTVVHLDTTTDSPGFNASLQDESQEVSRPSPGGAGEITHLRRRKGVVQFYGYSYHMNFYQQFPELRSYIGGVKAKNQMINIARDQVYPPQGESISHNRLGTNSVGASSLESLLPTKPVADALVQNYLDRFETMHRALDRSVFLAEYDRHWNDPLSSAPIFLIQLLLILATGASLHPDTCLAAWSEASIYTLTTQWIEAAESWLTSSHHHVPHSPQVIASHCLLLIAKRANYMQGSSFWTSTGALVRMAMAAGYHREVNAAARIAPYDQEMRRRLWITIVELDMQAALERGMPPTIRPGDFSTRMPLHVDDGEVLETPDDPQSATPLDTLTDCSFQNAFWQSMPTRCAICTYVNGCDGDIGFERVQELGEGLYKAIRDIPEWNTTGSDLPRRRTAMYLRTMLKIYLCQYSLLLYTKFTCQSPDSFQSSICRRARLEASTTIVECYRKLIVDEILERHACRTGLMVAALNICHEIYLSYGPGEAISMITNLGVSQHLLDALEQVLSILERRIKRTMHGLNEYYVLSMIIGLVKAKLSPETRVVSDKEAAHRATIVCTFLQEARASLLAADQPTYPVETQLASGAQPLAATLNDVTEALGFGLPDTPGFGEDDFSVDFFLQDPSSFFQ
ncbi:uncharacterized protein BP01DRAFT_395851 [Aspergillus saccharolyticus JOP 1030-1]|uniref:Zn(2)-C6 fungal-type domain-containing protein n=1 Tax=Aspergillus saccharolyticus JOP 1030-1 TaxID=1450539 RepID=A0A318Z238_9EURO|nr:hypothetical protein BP01DRAFT_395851 [Aspergillus saccharolyticus JOP 1030-1]PYH40454.1 hypothetical protein BP01DRAFT_395851 [Aspergillus saccharolyticus JOP 1030-1]